MQVDLLETLRTGRFGPVPLGASRGAVELALGVPEGWDPGPRGPGSRQAERWLYGAWELVFGADDALSFVVCERIEAWEQALSFHVDPGPLAAGPALTLVEAPALLRAADVRAWLWRQKVTGAGVVTGEGGASLVFYGPDDEPPQPHWTLSAVVLDGRARPPARLLDVDWAPPWAPAVPAPTAALDDPTEERPRDGA